MRCLLTRQEAKRASEANTASNFPGSSQQLLQTAGLKTRTVHQQWLHLFLSDADQSTELVLSFASEACSCSLLWMEATKTERNTGSWKQFPFCNTALSYSIHNRGRPDQGHLKTKYTYLTSPQMNVLFLQYRRVLHNDRILQYNLPLHELLLFPWHCRCGTFQRHQHQLGSAGHRACPSVCSAGTT